MNLPGKFFNLGVSAGQAEFIKKKVILTNQLILLIFLLAVLPFTIICIIDFVPLTYLPAGGGIVCFLVILINSVGLNKLSRFIGAILPSIVVVIFQASLLPAGQDPLPGALLLNFAFAFLPFVLFDLREPFLLVVTSIITMLTVLCTKYLIDAIEISEPLNFMLLNEGVMGTLNVMIGLFMGFGIITILIFINRSAEKQNEQLIAEMNLRQQELKESDEELRSTIKKFEEARELEMQRKKEDEKRTWAATGLAKFGDLLRQHGGEMSEFGFQIISNLVNYLGANQGGIFIINDDNAEVKFIEQIAGYAYNRRKFQEKRIEWGEGLIGQCILEAQSIYITDVPENYITITSGLGTANPNCLILVPLKLNEVTFGVVEIASFTVFDKYQVEFIENVSEDIASTIAGVKVNVKTAELLERTQQQAEEMKAQEEEMRQNMEEMLATQEESDRREQSMKQKMENMQHEIDILKNELSCSGNNSIDEETLRELNEKIAATETELQGIRSAIDNSLAVIEYDLSGNFLDANENMLRMLGCSKEDMEGKNHRDFSSQQETGSKEYEDFWATLASGYPREGEYFHIVPRGEVWFYETYVPVKNQNGEFYKVITIVSDNTQDKTGF